MEWNKEAVDRLRELWSQGLSTAEIGRQLNVTKNAVVGKVHRLGLQGRASPIRKASNKIVENSTNKNKLSTTTTQNEQLKPVKKEKNNANNIVLDESELKKETDLVDKSVSKPKKNKIKFFSPEELPKRRSQAECCWPIGDPGTKEFHFCGAPAVPGKPYCLEHIQIAYVKLRDRKSNVA